MQVTEGNFYRTLHGKTVKILFTHKLLPHPLSLFPHFGICLETEHKMYFNDKGNIRSDDVTTISWDLVEELDR